MTLRTLQYSSIDVIKDTRKSLHPYHTTASTGIIELQVRVPVPVGRYISLCLFVQVSYQSARKIAFEKQGLHFPLFRLLFLFRSDV